MGQSQVLDSWQHPVPVSWEPFWGCSAVIQAQCWPVQDEGVGYFTRRMHPAIAVQLGVAVSPAL